MASYCAAAKKKKVYCSFVVSCLTNKKKQKTFLISCFLIIFFCLFRKKQTRSSVYTNPYCIKISIFPFCCSGLAKSLYVQFIIYLFGKCTTHLLCIGTIHSIVNDVKRDISCLSLPYAVSLYVLPFDANSCKSKKKNIYIVCFAIDMIWIFDCMFGNQQPESYWRTRTLLFMHRQTFEMMWNDTCERKKKK